jgi:bifunctional UDP-N-acetylglucosamine pyrophosphorylase/glucosamine-1-phosphate N-acetyltransferase
VNSRVDLAKAEKALNQRKLEALMNEGVTFISPETCVVSDDVTVGADTVIWPQTFLLGKTKIGSGCQIGPWTHIKNTIVEDGASIKASFCDDSIIRTGAQVGPYSRVRPNSEIGENAHLGNFSEVKNTRLGGVSKVNHLSYLGDAKIGKCVNIGAGSITCNYDGIQKHPTEIQDHSFIGSNVNLVAPVRVGAHAVVGAGSTISDNVPDWSLAVERAPLKVKDDWAKQRFHKSKKDRKKK